MPLSALTPKPSVPVYSFPQKPVGGPSSVIPSPQQATKTSVTASSIAQQTPNVATTSTAQQQAQPAANTAPQQQQASTQQNNNPESTEQNNNNATNQSYYSQQPAFTPPQAKSSQKANNASKQSKRKSPDTASPFRVTVYRGKQVELSFPLNEEDLDKYIRPLADKQGLKKTQNSDSDS